VVPSRPDALEEGDAAPDELSRVIPERPEMGRVIHEGSSFDPDDNLGNPCSYQVETVLGSLSYDRRGEGSRSSLPVGPCADHRVCIRDR